MEGGVIMFNITEYKKAAFTICINTKCKKRNNCWMYANKKELDEAAKFRMDMYENHLNLGISAKIYECNKNA